MNNCLINFICGGLEHYFNHMTCLNVTFINVLCMEVQLNLIAAMGSHISYKTVSL